MKTILTIACLLTALNSFTELHCRPSKDRNVSITIEFHKQIDPLKPFIGLPYFGATLIVENNKFYKNTNLKLTPERSYQHLDLRGDAEGVYLKLYPQINSQTLFTHYEGQLFINDLNVRAYYNYVDSEFGAGFICD
jgi:hypothetical protein